MSNQYLHGNPIPYCQIKKSLCFLCPFGTISPNSILIFQIYSNYCDNMFYQLPTRRVHLCSRQQPKPIPAKLSQMTSLTRMYFVLHAVATNGDMLAWQLCYGNREEQVSSQVCPQFAGPHLACPQLSGLHLQHKFNL